MKKYNLLIRRIYRGLIYSLAVIAVVAAVGISLLRILLSTVETYHDDIEDLASAYLDYRVEIKNIGAKVVGFTPSLIFEKVRILDKTGSKVVINLNSVRIGVSPIQSWKSGQIIPAEVIVDGVELLVVRNKDNTIHIQDVDVSQFTTADADSSNQGLDENDLTNLFFSRTNLVLSNSSVIWKDYLKNTESRRFDQVTLRMQNDGDHHRFYGSLKLPQHYGKKVDVAMNIVGSIRLPTTWKGELYLNANGLNLDKINAPLLTKDISFTRGTVDIELWSEINNGRLKRLTGNVALFDVAMGGAYFTKQYNLEHLGGIFDARLSGDDWKLAVDQFKVISQDYVWPTTKFSISHTTEKMNDPAVVTLMAEYFRLEDLTGLLKGTKILPKDLYNKLIKMNPSGDISQLSLTTVLSDRSPSSFNVQAFFNNLVFNANGTLPGIRGLNGNVWANETHGRLELGRNHSVAVDIPKIFRIPIQLTQLDSSLYWENLNNQWTIWSNEILAQSPDIKATSELLLTVSEKQSPYIDFQTRFVNGDASHVSDYVPVAIMDQELIDWIDNSIKGGNVIEGGGIFRGRFADFPFIQHAGAFVVDFTAKDAEVDYMPGWPKISEAKFDGHFDSFGVQVALSEARVLSSRIKDSHISINEFLNPMIIINGTANGDLSDIPRFLVDSPISPQSREFVKESKFSGRAKTEIYVQIPLSEEMKEVSSAGYKGRLNIQSGRIKLVEDRIDLRNIKGGIDFSDEGELSKNVSATLFDEPVGVELFSYRRNADIVRTLVLQVPVDSKQLYTMAGLKKNNHIKGKSDWQAVFSTSYDDNDRTIPSSLRLSSNLEGTELNLLSPILKQKHEQENVDMTFLFKDKTTDVELNLANKLSSKFAFKDNKLMPNLGIHFGEGSTQLPDSNKIMFTGSLDNFNLSEWLALVDDFTPKKKSDAFTHTPIFFNMQNLTLKKINEDENKNKNKNKNKNANITPKDIPYLKGTIKNLVYDGKNIGQFETELVPGNRQVRIKKVNISSPDYQLNVSGLWKQKLLGHSTSIVIDLKSSDTAKMLKKMGYAAVIKDGTLVLNGSISWSGRPNNIDWENIDGALKINIKEGALLNVDAGAGRLLGLFSLNELPRRLSLDFQDTFNSGFSFDEISGDLTLTKGNIITDNLVAKSPVADILVSGRTGYVAQDFDQNITVIPAVSDTLPIAGGLLFGLEIGVAILIIDAIVGEEINKANLREYHLTGSWDEPVFTDLTPKVVVEPDAEDEI